ncbi:MAG: zf-HC2 domain-containing protein [Bacteroidales bacterium]|nr:zf-HC2 domain-containing protein [Bacteroidales bacterium]
MSCIKKGTIQKYIDGECTLSETVQIERHLADCKKCSVNVEYQRKLASGLRKALSLLSQESKGIPIINVPDKTARTRLLTVRRLAYILAAACIILFVVIISQKKEPENQAEIIMIEPGFATEFDANQPVSDQQMIMTIIDSEGKKTEYFE